LGPLNPNQRKGPGSPAKSKRPGKNQKKDWFKQQQDAKGKGKATNEVSFTNEVVVEPEPEYVEEDFLPPSFLQMQEDYDMEDSSSTIAHAGWDEEDSGMNVARLSSMPSRYGSFKECPFWRSYCYIWDVNADEEKGEKEKGFFHSRRASQLILLFWQYWLVEWDPYPGTSPIYVHLKS